MAGMASRLIAAAAILMALAILVLGPVDNAIKQTLSPEARRVRDLKARNPVQPAAIGKVLKGSSRLATAPSHPLDPLTFSELEIVRDVLISAGELETGKAQVHGVELVEPPKAEVLAWTKGDPLPARQAFSTIWKDGKTHMVVVDVSAKTVVSHTLYTGSGKPLLSAADFAAAASVPLTYKPFQDSMALRNLTISDALCMPLAGGYFADGEKFRESERRIVRSTCYHAKYVNYHMEPIDGIVMYIDLDTQEIYNYIDEGYRPNGPASLTDYTPELQIDPIDPPFKAISIEQPEGVNFKVDGYGIQWDKWALHVAPHPRAGMVISRVQFNDTFTGSVRDIMYQGHLSEMFVPYQDPSPSWFFRTYMDVGEYGFGNLAMGLMPLNDCPKNAHYIDFVMADPNGNPTVVPNMMCVFERYAGDAVWRHTDPFISSAREVRPKVTLVARQAATVGNYDYTVDFEFQTDGLIRVTVTMSGMVTVKAVTPATSTDATNADAPLYGTYVSEHTVAVNHDHFINFRLDMDVDGPSNSVMEAKLVAKKVPEGSSWRKSIWEVETLIPKTELEAQFNISGLHPAEYFVINKGSTTRLGNTRSYKLVGRTSSAPVMDELDSPEVRAAWCQNSIYVTPYEPSERWAGGLFPNQAKGEDTLPVWTKKNRSVDETDVVVWYNIGYHHVPVQEDFPVMPSTLATFDIKPANFFEANPAIKAQSFVDREPKHGLTL